MKNDAIAGGMPPSKVEDAGMAENTGEDRNDGELADGSACTAVQKCWSFVRERNSVSEERLAAVALSDGARDYTYRLMFRKWDLYAEVFSSLGVTEGNGSRAGLTGVPSAETVFAFYALNMTGASVSMVHSADLRDAGRWRRMVEEEGITDLVLADSMADPELMDRLVRERVRLGIRNIVVLPVSSREKAPAEGAPGRHLEKSRLLREYRGVLFMDELLRRYAGCPILCGKEKNDSAAVIAHTSGTVKGIHKPVPLSDAGLNAAAESLLSDERFRSLDGRAVSALFMDLSSAYAMTDMVHLPLSFGGKIVLGAGVRYVEDILALIGEHKVNVLFSTGPFMRAAMKVKEKPDLSQLAFVFLGGSSVSPYLKGRIDAFLEGCGAKIRSTPGYGLSETAGACILFDPDSEGSPPGKPLPGVKVKLYDEEEDRFYDPEDGRRRGVLFVHSPSVSGGRIGKTAFFHLREIDGLKYLNTFDLFEADEEGGLHFAGRMNKYFVNNEGIRFGAGQFALAG